MIFSQPVRKIPKNYRNITGKFASKKTSKLIAYESKLERDFLYLFEFENYILDIVEQPMSIHYKIGNSTRKYTPDFFLKTPVGHNNLIIEVKYHDDLKKTFRESKLKYQALLENLNGEEIDFYFCTDRCPMIKSEDYKFNIHFLINYNELDLEHYSFIQKHFSPFITIQEILNLYSQDKYVQLILLSSIWCMFRRKILITNLYEKLSLETKIFELRHYDHKLYLEHLAGKINKGYLL